MIYRLHWVWDSQNESCLLGLNLGCYYHQVTLVLRWWNWKLLLLVESVRLSSCFLLIVYQFSTQWKDKINTYTSGMQLTVTNIWLIQNTNMSTSYARMELMQLYLDQDLNKRFKRTLFIRTKRNLQIFGAIPFIRLQSYVRFIVEYERYQPLFQIFMSRPAGWWLLCRSLFFSCIGVFLWTDCGCSCVFGPGVPATSARWGLDAAGNWPSLWPLQALWCPLHRGAWPLG